ncbi:MAG: hypothetical protein DIU60_000075 [Actinomycetes bacterium]|jgi:ribose/xylose/arabinose/galactoside ABC-type transport system permease subunit|nr:MAG: hypothetical protein DIU60_03735 [Actinomycetota bacterium]
MNEGRAEQTDVTLPSWKEVLSTPPPRRVFDEPATPADEPEVRDRIAVHVVWEILLAIAAAGLVMANLSQASAQHLTGLLGSAGVVGLLAVGLSFSFRTVAPNLAVGAIAAATGAFVAVLVRDGWSATTAIAAGIGAALAVGVLLGLLVMVLSVPAWAVTLGAAVVLAAAVPGLTQGTAVEASLGTFPAIPAFVAFAALSMIGGAVWLIPGVRRALAGLRREGDPAERAGLRAGLGALAGLAGSSLLAGAAGILDLMRLNSAAAAAEIVPVTALAAVLIGGVSVYGRRAGIFGTLLGVVIMVSAGSLLAMQNTPAWLVQAFGGGMVVAGLLVSRLVEGVNATLNRRRGRREPRHAASDAGKA